MSAPWLLPGYWFGTDWPGPRRIPFPNEISSSAALQIGLAATSWAVGGEAASKLFIAGFLLLAAVLAYRSIPGAGFIAGATAATVYVCNPFVYGRLQYGQLYLLAGYAILPWVATRARQLLLKPRLGNAILAAASLVVLGIPSLHLFFASAVLLAPLAAAHVVANRRSSTYWPRLVPLLAVTCAVTLGASAYWIIPLLTGSGPEGSRLAGIGTGDLYAFAVIPDRQFGLVPNLLGLYGFWAEDTGRFASMKGFVPLWPAILAAVLAIGIIGAISALRQRNNQAPAWVAGLLIAALVALILEAGVSDPVTRVLVTWLDGTFPVYRGMRDAGKWAALLALVYSQMIALGVGAILAWIRARPWPRIRTEWLGAVATALLLAMPLYYGNGLLFGMHGETKPSQYPTGWYAADRVLASDKHAGRTLFLPWHEYMTLSFVRNQNQLIAPPAPTFFSTEVVVSANPEVPGIAPPANSEQVAVANLVQQAGQGQWGQVLADLGIKYVLLAREVDWETYRYLDQQADLLRVGDYGSIVLYRNRLVT